MNESRDNTIDDKIITKCCVCGKVNIENQWVYLPDTYITRQYKYSHGYCPEDYEKALREVMDYED